MELFEFSTLNLLLVFTIFNSLKLSSVTLPVVSGRFESVQICKNTKFQTWAKVRRQIPGLKKKLVDYSPTSSNESRMSKTKKELNHIKDQKPGSICYLSSMHVHNSALFRTDTIFILGKIFSQFSAPPRKSLTLLSYLKCLLS